MEFFIDNINLLIFLPMLMCLVLGFNGLISNKADVETMSLMSLISSAISLVFGFVSLACVFMNNTSFSSGFTWLSVENVSFYFGTFLDKISVVFVNLGVLFSFFVQLFMYFKIDKDFDFYKWLLLTNLFTFGFCGIFLSQNLFQTYLFCEVVGLAAYLLISFDFSNRENSKAGIKSFIYNRIGDLSILFCVLSILYYSVFYNELNGVLALAYSEISSISATINSLLPENFYVVFCSLLLFAIIMKFVQAFVYLSFENLVRKRFFVLIFLQNSLLSLVGIYLFLRVQPFFSYLGEKWLWTFVALLLFVCVCALLFYFVKPFCKLCFWVEKYVFEAGVNFFEFGIRGLSYFANNLQKGNFQSYLIYSFLGLIFIFVFVLVFYIALIKN